MLGCLVSREGNVCPRSSECHHGQDQQHDRERSLHLRDSLRVLPRLLVSSDSELHCTRSTQHMGLLHREDPPPKLDGHGHAELC
jgi:hypothetical protein